jgi:DNA repair protein RadA/Sms
MRRKPTMAARDSMRTQGGGSAVASADGQVRLHLPRLRRHQPQVAGQVPALQRLEHAGRRPGRGGGGTKNRFQSLARSQPVATLSEIDASEVVRTPTGQEELDRVLGGGIVPGGVVLIGGDPGIGKSTLLLQALDALSQQMKVLYVTGEESGAQVALRARRLGLSGTHVRVQAEIQLERIIATLDAERPSFCVIDSIQTMYSDQLSSAPGSVAQVRECAAQLTRVAKTSGCTMVLVGHVTKEGALAGPRVLEHIVDTVLYFEGDTHSSFRLVRAIKNRFGAVNEIGVFAMTEKGLKGVSNPSAIFLSTHSEPVPGSCVLVTLEGTRPLLVEIQALVDSGGPSPRRLSVGLDRDRLAMLLAVLHRHAGVACMDQDVFVNAVGGVRIAEPAADLAVLLAIQSSLRGRPLPRGFVAFGEVGLAGEVRPAPRGQDRLREAAKLGFGIAVVPKANVPKKRTSRGWRSTRWIASSRRWTWCAACSRRPPPSGAAAPLASRLRAARSAPAQFIAQPVGVGRQPPPPRELARPAAGGDGGGDLLVVDAGRGRHQAHLQAEGPALVEHVVVGQAHRQQAVDIGLRGLAVDDVGRRPGAAAEHHRQPMPRCQLEVRLR